MRQCFDNAGLELHKGINKVIVTRHSWALKPLGLDRGDFQGIAYVVIVWQCIRGIFLPHWCSGVAETGRRSDLSRPMRMTQFLALICAAPNSMGHDKKRMKEL